MGVLSDVEIRNRCNVQQVPPYKPMITPFEEAQDRPGIISYGVSHYGYDFRITDEFLIFDPSLSDGIVDPKNFDDSCLRPHTGPYCIIPPNSFVLATTLETWAIPQDVLCICIGKSTYARVGLIINVTPFEPGWEGQATIEISNTTGLPAKIYANEGIGQAIFYTADIDTTAIASDMNLLRQDSSLESYHFSNSLMYSSPSYRKTCAVTYADKGGKYQDQVGIVLPIVNGTEEVTDED